MTIRTLEIGAPEKLGRGATEEKELGWGVRLLPQSWPETAAFAKPIQPAPEAIRPQLPTSIGSLLDDRLQLRIPVGLELEQEGDSHIARCPEFEEFGYGKSVMEAIDDLRLTLAELYWTLKEEQTRLGPSLMDLWQRLEEKVEVVKEA